jgi:hypothetical protein
MSDICGIIAPSWVKQVRLVMKRGEIRKNNKLSFTYPKI